MKKLFFLLMITLLASASMLAQDTIPPVPVPGSVMDVFADLKGWFASTTAVAGLTIFLTLLLAKIKPELKPIIKQVIALAVAIVLIIVGNVANIGFMADFNAQSTIVYGLVTGFIANGWYDLKNLAK